MSKDTIPVEFVQNMGLAGVTSDQSSVVNFGKALLTIAGADVEVSAKEMTWLTQHARLAGVPDDIVAEWESFDYKSAKLEDYLSAILDGEHRAVVAKNMLYNAIQMSQADDEYARPEKEAVDRAAELLNVAPEIVETLESIAKAEGALRMASESLRTARKAIFAAE